MKSETYSKEVKTKPNNNKNYQTQQPQAQGKHFAVLSKWLKDRGFSPATSNYLHIIRLATVDDSRGKLSHALHPARGHSVPHTSLPAGKMKRPQVRTKPLTQIL